MADASLFGMPMKYVALFTLTLQNSALILIMHYSRIMPEGPTGRYLTSTAVAVNEVIKLVLSLAMVVRDRRRVDGPGFRLKHVVHEVFTPDCWKLMIPAILYTVQNNLQYVGASYLDAATFQVTYQLKILTTALFSVTMLKRSYSLTKWISLFLLTVGVALVQLPSGDVSPSSHTGQEPVAAPAVESEPESRFARLLVRRAAEAAAEGGGVVSGASGSTIGLTAVVVACVISGLAGVYFEKVLKGSKASLWVRNVQLSFFSLFPAFVLGVLLKDGKEVMEKGFFNGYNMVVWTAIMFQAIGGIVVALCVAYADNIMKNFATSVSILISFVASVYFFDFVITLNFLIGCGIVLFATYLYTLPDKKPSGSTSTNGPGAVYSAVPESDKQQTAVDVKSIAHATLDGAASTKGNGHAHHRHSSMSHEDIEAQIKGARID